MGEPSSLNENYLSSSHDDDDDIDDASVISTVIAEKDTPLLAFASCKVYWIMALTALAFGSVTYVFSARSQQRKLKVEFQRFASEAAGMAENNANSTFGQLQTLATAMTSVTQALGDAFPYTVVPHFDLRTSQISHLTGLEMILWAPFVEEEDLIEWEQFMALNREEITWQNYDNVTEQQEQNVFRMDAFSSRIYNYSTPSGNYYNETRRGYTNEGNFMEKVLFDLGYEPNLRAPIAQFGPQAIDWSLSMMDLMSHPTMKKEMVAALEYNVPVISESEELDFLLRHIGRQDTQHPVAGLRSFTLDHVKSSFSHDAKTVGFVIGIIAWHAFFENMNGIVIKVTSDCGRNFTYVATNDGKNDWAADGDHYNIKYDDLVQKFKFFWKQHPKGTSRHCHFDLYMYPTDEFAALYINAAPVLYCAVVVLAVLLAAILFAIYVKQAKRRNLELKESAEKANNVVTNLFPKHVGEQLMNNSVIKGGVYNSKVLEQRGVKHSNTYVSAPLAELYEDCTVVFADLVGFTNWASSREPTQVLSCWKRSFAPLTRLLERNVL